MWESRLVFNADDYSKDYETLKKEVKFLAALTRYSFIHMSKRLIIIRDNKLYRKDGYASFKDFIEGEIPLSRSTVYNYIVTFFGVQLVGQMVEVEYSKLLPLLPLLKANNDKIPKEKIKQRFLEIVETKTKNEIAKEAREYKKEYGLARESNVRIGVVFMYLQRNIPDNLTANDKEIIAKMIEHLKQRLIE